MKPAVSVLALSLALGPAMAAASPATTYDKLGGTRVEASPPQAPAPKFVQPKAETPPADTSGISPTAKVVVGAALVVWAAYCALYGCNSDSDDAAPGDGYTSGWGRDGLLYCYSNTWQSVRECWNMPIARR